MIAYAAIRANYGAKRIDLYLPAAATVFRHTFYQCRFVVLDSAADWQNPVTTFGRVSSSLEYVSTFLSDHAACRVPLRRRLEQMAQPAVASGSARISYNVGSDLSFPVSGPLTGSNRCTTGKPNPLAA